VHDKTVRRRRAVLALLVAVSLISLTAYFGESPNSPLHSVQRGIVEVLSPVQEGASKALSPVRDIAGWFSSTFRAKSQVGKLKKELQTYEAEAAQYRQASLQNQQLSALVHLDNSIGIANYHAVTASVIERDPLVWYEQIEVDKGSDDGVAVGDPAIGDGGLVGDVTTVGATYSIVSLITDHTMAVAATVQNGAGDSGVLVPDVGNPTDLLLQYLPRSATITVGETVVTTGFKYGNLQDLYPAGIPIGTVSNASVTDLYNNGQVHVSPIVDLRHLSVVQILTTPHGAGERASLAPSG
jgi:rod shape-determining protein MreC